MSRFDFTPALEPEATSFEPDMSLTLAMSVANGWALLPSASLARDCGALAAADWSLTLVAWADPQPDGASTFSLARDVLPQVTRGQRAARQALAALAQASWEDC